MASILLHLRCFGFFKKATFQIAQVHRGIECYINTLWNHEQTSHEVKKCPYVHENLAEKSAINL